METLWIVIPLLVAATASILGAQRGDRPLTDPALLLIVGCCVLAAVAVAVGAHDSEVSDGAYAKGIAVAAVGLGVVPVLAYWFLGRALARHMGWLIAAWLASLIPVGYYLIVVLLVTYDLAHCPPDAYECPL